MYILPRAVSHSKSFFTLGIHCVHAIHRLYNTCVHCTYPRAVSKVMCKVYGGRRFVLQSSYEIVGRARV